MAKEGKRLGMTRKEAAELKEKYDILKRELEYQEARNKTLVKEVTALNETIKARDAKNHELVVANNKNAATAEHYKKKLSAAVKMYEEEERVLRKITEDQSYKIDQAADRIFELEQELEFVRCKNRNMEGAVKEAVGLAATNAQYLQRIEELEEEVNMFVSGSYEEKELEIDFPSSEMKTVSNLIMDMTLNGATKEEIDRVIKYSIAVMDAAKDYNIGELRTKYQGEKHE